MNSIDANLIKNGTIDDWVVVNVPDKNVGDLISRQALKNALTNWQMEYAEKDKDVERFETLGAVIDLVEQMPTIEPKKGKWITKKDACGIDYQICSNCETEIQWRNRHGVILRVDTQNLPYCPNCGAKMGEVDDEHTD